MKKNAVNISKLGVILFVVLLVGCMNSEYHLAVFPSNEFVRTADVIVAGGSTSGKIMVYANCDWTLDTKTDFLMLTKKEGSKTDSVPFLVSVNPSSVLERTADVTLTTAGGIMTKIIVRQGKNDELIELAPDSLEFFANESDTLEFYVVANGHWTINGKPNWVYLSQTEGVGRCGIKVSVTENTSDLDRNPATIVVSGDNGTTASLKIKQSGRDALIAVSPSRIEAAAAEQIYGFTIYGKVAWNIVVSDDWIYDLSVDEGYDKKYVSFKCRDNLSLIQRSGSIIVHSESKRQKDSLMILQRPAALAIMSIPELIDCNEILATFAYSINSSFPVIEFGLCYALTENPTTQSKKVKFSSDSITDGDFVTTITGLTKGQRYYVRAYAISAVGTSYSVDCVFEAKSKPSNDDNDRPVF